MGRNVLGRYENSVYIEKNEWSPSSLHVDALSARLGEWSNVLFKSRPDALSSAVQTCHYFSQVDAGALHTRLTLSQGPLST